MFKVEQVVGAIAVVMVIGSFLALIAISALKIIFDAVTPLT